MPNRHGLASQVSIHIKFLNDAIQMQIKDNGIGMEDIKYGFGAVSSMSDRMRTVGGMFKVQSELTNMGLR